MYKVAWNKFLPGTSIQLHQNLKLLFTWHTIIIFALWCDLYYKP